MRTYSNQSLIEQIKELTDNGKYLAPDRYFLIDTNDTRASSLANFDVVFEFLNFINDVERFNHALSLKLDTSHLYKILHSLMLSKAPSKDLQVILAVFLHKMQVASRKVNYLTYEFDDYSYDGLDNSLFYFIYELNPTLDFEKLNTIRNTILLSESITEVNNKISQLVFNESVNNMVDITVLDEV